MNRIIGTLIVVGVLFTGTSCKRKVSVPGGSIEQSGDQVKIQTGDGSSFVAGGNVKLPEGFPDDLPQPSGELEMAMKMPQGFNVAFKCKESQADLFTKLQEEFKARGWEEVMATQTANGSVLTYKKDSDRHVQCSIGDSKGRTVVSMMVTKR